MAVADSHDTAHDDHHDHGEFIAHHFDSPEQQFDSGKLGIWVFLVTEVLFFSGLFVAYTLWRNHHPDVFQQAHVFLNKYLGGMNTIVLLFSSLTMALAVRCAQLGKNKQCSLYLLITMVCASMFLGVKAVEYSHKWDMGIFVRSAFNYDAGHHAAEAGTLAASLGVSPYLITLCFIPAVLLLGFVVAAVIGKLIDKPLLSKFLVGMSITVGGYFLGVVVGQIFVSVTEGGSHASVVAPAEPLMLHAMTADDKEKGKEEAKADEKKSEGDEKKSADGDKKAANGEEHADGEGHNHADGEDHADDEILAHDSEHHPASHGIDPAKFDRDIGTFFSIYYCMTGLHAIHIIGGIIALAWLYWRSLAAHWRPDYFGPVDFVGLYWHLVDLIWIYLFPLLYLIE